MADQIFAFTPTVPAGTQIATPFTQQLHMPACVVVSIGVVVPPGPRGVMGFALGAAGQMVIPQPPGTWLVLDDFADDWPLENQISSGAWEFFGYNLGGFPHTVYLRFAVNFPTIAGFGAAVPAATPSVTNEPSHPSPTSS